MVGFEHAAVVGREDGVSPHDILESLIDPRHVAFQAPISCRAGEVMRMSPAGVLGDEFLVTLQADRLVLGPSPGPPRSDRLMRVVAVDALQLRVTPSASCVGVLDRIPRPHPGSEFRPRPGVTAATGPVEIRVSPARLEPLSRRLGQQVRTFRGKFRQLFRVRCVTTTPQVTGFAADPQSDAEFPGIHSGKHPPQYLQLFFAD